MINKKNGENIMKMGLEEEMKQTVLNKLNDEMELSESLLYKKTVDAMLIIAFFPLISFFLLFTLSDGKEIFEIAELYFPSFNIVFKSVFYFIIPLLVIWKIWLEYRINKTQNKINRADAFLNIKKQSIE